jgi:CDP-diacylglycerol--glycerol-3-phosphate 3-phosphatidyltransferase
MAIDKIPNVISVLRTAGSVGLLFCDVNGWPFWLLYALCGISDMVDGWLARKLHAETKTGAILDSG